MLRSLGLYAEFFLKTLSQPEWKILFSDMIRYRSGSEVLRKIRPAGLAEKMQSLSLATGWLLEAQKATGDGGMGSYHLANGWSSSYPETTGYIIPTLIRYGKDFNKPEALEAALTAADFLLGIQKESGGWQGGRVNEDKHEIVFNTGQVIRGMMAAFELSENRKYLDAAIRAGNWLCAVQHPEGFWKTHALMEQERVYDTFVDAPLLQLAEITGDDKYRKAAIRNLDWVIHEKMEENGWFRDCDNTVKRNDRPILHTIAYTLDGLIDCSLMLNKNEYLEAATTGASVLRDRFLETGRLFGRYDRHWKGTEYFLCTGGAQMAIVWMKLYLKGLGDDYFRAAQKMTDLLVFVQGRQYKERPVTEGAIPGSFPLWGRYEPFAFPNWATKFFCDALMLEAEILKS